MWRQSLPLVAPSSGLGQTVYTLSLLSIHRQRILYFWSCVCLSFIYNVMCFIYIVYIHLLLTFSSFVPELMRLHTTFFDAICSTFQINTNSNIIFPLKLLSIAYVCFYIWAQDKKHSENNWGNITYWNINRIGNNLTNASMIAVFIIDIKLEFEIIDSMNFSHKILCCFRSDYCDLSNRFDDTNSIRFLLKRYDSFQLKSSRHSTLMIHQPFWPTYLPYIFQYQKKWSDIKPAKYHSHIFIYANS